MASLETVEQIVEQVNEEKSDLSNGNSGKNKPSIKEEIEQTKSRLSNPNVLQQHRKNHQLKWAYK